MQPSFSYEVCQRNSAMYPKPVLTPAQQQYLQLETQNLEPGYTKDPLWVCSLCKQPVLDEQGRQKYARAFQACFAKEGAKQEPDNWYHCDPCRQASRDDKRALALRMSAAGTPCIDKVLPAAEGSKW